MVSAGKQLLLLQAENGFLAEHSVCLTGVFCYAHKQSQLHLKSGKERTFPTISLKIRIEHEKKKNKQILLNMSLALPHSHASCTSVHLFLSIACSTHYKNKIWNC